MRYFVLLLLSVSVISCSSQKQEQDDLADIKETEIKRLNKHILQLERKHREAIDEARSKSQKMADSLRADIQRRDQKIEELDETLEKAKEYVKKLKQHYALRSTPTATKRPRSRVSDFIHYPIGNNPDLFPVHVFDVRGKKVRTGSHTEERWVDPAVVVRDQYGRRRAGSGKWKTWTVTEFGYQVHLSIRNLTKTHKSISYSAGKTEKTVSIPPGDVIKGITIEASKDSSLSVTALGETRTYRVTW